MAGTKISAATTTTPVMADMIPFARTADAVARHMTNTALAALLFDRAIVFNESGADVDYRFEGDNDANLLYLEGGNDRIGIGDNTPDGRFAVTGRADEVQTIIKAHSTQTSNIAEIKSSAGTVLIAITGTGGLVVNEAGVDVDSRFEGNSDANLWYLDAGNDRIGLGTATPSAKLHVNGDCVLGTDGSTITELTIAGGVITITKAFHTVDTYNDDATDDLDTINGGVLGEILFLKTEHTDRTVVIKHGVGNIFCLGAANISLTATSHLVMLVRHYGGNWAALPLYNG